MRCRGRIPLGPVRLAYSESHTPIRSQEAAPKSSPSIRLASWTKYVARRASETASAATHPAGPSNPLAPDQRSRAVQPPGALRSLPQRANRSSERLGSASGRNAGGWRDCGRAGRSRVTASGQGSRSDCYPIVTRSPPETGATPCGARGCVHTSGRPDLNRGPHRPELWAKSTPQTEKPCRSDCCSSSSPPFRSSDFAVDSRGLGSEIELLPNRLGGWTSLS